jgi:hypothetical protein
MKSKVLFLLCAFALMLAPATSFAASPAAESMPEPTSSVSVLGFGIASAVPDSVQVRMMIGPEQSFGPVGPEFEIPDYVGVELVRNILIENEVEESAIQVDLLSSNFPLGLLMPGSAVSFAYPDPAGLYEFLRTLVSELEARHGPAIQNVQLAFLVNDCGTLEEAAMKAALENARQRAARMAGLLEMNLGRVIAISEEHGANVAVGASGGCIAMSGLASFGLESMMSSMSPLTNSLDKVEVGILLEATFALEP